MEPKKIREMKAEELALKLKDLRTELLKVRFTASVGQLKNPLKKKEIRKDIARMLTIMKEKEIGE
ncbi:MAG: 50S ribosomal protein L29 [Candidatus Saganbacteria bacterium]|nr:50S ribosomal protein L29 [Candidatus Saganbacteria bacterium]